MATACKLSACGTRKARCSPERRMFEPLLLANSYTHTLRHQCSRASTIFLGTCTVSRVFTAAVLCVLAAWAVWLARLFSWVAALRIFAALFLGGLTTRFVIRIYLAVGCSRIARGAPWAGSVTGGEACGYPCSEKEGFTHPWLWRAPCFWGTYE